MAAGWARDEGDVIATAGRADRRLAPDRAAGAGAGAAHLRAHPPGRPLRPIAGRASGGNRRRRAHRLPPGGPLRAARHGELRAAAEGREAPDAPARGPSFPPYHAIADPTQRRLAVVRLHVEGWNAKSIAAYLETSRQTVHTTLKRWAEEE